MARKSYTKIDIELRNTRAMRESMDYISKSVAKAIANKSSEILLEIAYGAIAQYYDEYTPKSYNRSGQFYNSARPFRKQTNGRGRKFIGGVSFSGDGISVSEARLFDDRAYHQDVWSVVQMNIDGWHGGIHSNETIYDRVSGYMHNKHFYKELNKAKNAALSSAISNSVFKR